MSVRLYMDVHVPRAISQGLRLRGADVLTAQQDDARRLSDSELLDRANSLGRVLFTRDADLLAEVKHGEHPAELGPAESPIVRIVEEVPVVVPVDEKAYKPETP